MGDNPDFESEWYSEISECPTCKMDQEVDYTDYLGVRYYRCTVCNEEWSEE